MAITITTGGLITGGYPGGAIVTGGYGGTIAVPVPSDLIMKVYLSGVWEQVGELTVYYEAI